ncbi:SDR family NAD(P)-dependent oxidoreductase [Leptospira gomenensis]|uniref:SDR family NAD(P)-dependent oxidoreductase n=1 Tax=Leptospira gomenensis TaxID=2484974 RepID=A0A5F1YWY0_9LEPT|nr:SDR family NAD(P)-dependent oxidoreductase [Leptospira gomenensis]TGK38397.1 SDR family NAD(P)-dependent oxidoreductase [Leptospira gomenensis]TGK39317.1 SDR family NAD(P)-dependent oxidoreductase [Leptospira gomenensis]TGK52211.1 SDR family NAD(P)-dependent oxidoreductase [Leptospira gomenensis]TGK62935.1 SDR family NAD(P)-dependent oxidoreductase [Leptospira gomenensis]
MNPDFWKGKTVVVTGGSSGIGEAVLDRLSEIDCTLINLSRTYPPLFKRKTSVVAQRVHIPTDIASEKDVDHAVKKISKDFRSVDVLFANAGVTTHSRFDGTRIDTFRKTFDINFFGPIHLIQRLLPQIKLVRGTVIATSTVSGLYGIPGRSAYSSSKSALHAALEAARIELSEQGLSFILFCPPYTKTNLRASGLDGDGKPLNEGQHSNAKIKTPEEVALKMLSAVETPNSRLVIMDSSGFFLKWLRNIAPAFLERTLFKKLYKDFH